MNDATLKIENLNTAGTAADGNTALIPQFTISHLEVQAEQLMPAGYGIAFTNGLWVTLTGTNSFVLLFYKPRN